MDRPYFEELSIRCLTGEATTAEQDRLVQAIENRVEYQLQFEELKKIWTASQAGSSRVDVDLAWHEISERLAFGNSTVDEIAEHRNKMAAWKIWTVVAGILLIIGSLWLYRTMTSDVFPMQTPLVSQAEIEEHTQHGERRTIQLPDHSEVYLNVGTTLRYQAGFADSLRIVRLDGEAFFDVESDGRPFIVQTPTTTIRVLGTSFNVRARAKTTTVIVKEGQVSVQDVNRKSQDGVVLSPGQQSIHRPGQNITRPETVDAEEALGWLRGELVFNGISIEQVVAELNRVFDVRIIVEDEQIRSRTITATFDEQSIDVALRAICLAANVDFRLENDTYIIFPRIE